VLDLTIAQPTFEDLIGTMTNQRRLLDKLLFRHAEIAMLIAAGEHRFVSAAIDEALEVETEVGAVDLARAMTADALGCGETVSEIAAGAPDHVAQRLLRLSEHMARTLAEINTYRARAAGWAGDRSSRLSKAIDAGAAGTTGTGYSADGSAL
jgi:hypothetical protein